MPAVVEASRPAPEAPRPGQKDACVKGLSAGSIEREKEAGMKLVIAFCVVMLPGAASAQHRSADTGSGGAAVPASSSSGSTSSSSGGSSSSSSSGADSAQFSSSNNSGTASFIGHRTGSITIAPNPASANTTSGAFTNYSGLSSAPEFSRPRTAPIEIAVPKGSVPTNSNGVTVIVGAYDPWLYAYGGLAGIPFYGVFDPFAAGFGFTGPTVWTTTPVKEEKGVLRLRVKPRDAEVYVDGGLVGQVNQFESLFHKLRLEAGVHRVELRAPGYQPLIFNARIVAGESMTYSGTLEKTAP